MGEVRRQIAKGMTLLDKEAWTPQLDYRNSLALRSERTVIDSSAPYAMRIEQIYRPAIELSAEPDDEGADPQARAAGACRRTGSGGSRPPLSSRASSERSTASAAICARRRSRSSSISRRSKTARR